MAFNPNFESMFGQGPGIIQPFSLPGATGQPPATVTHLTPDGMVSSFDPDTHTGVSGRGTTTTNQPITYNVSVVHHPVNGLPASLPQTYEFHFVRAGDFKAKKRTGDTSSVVRSVSQLNAYMNTIDARNKYGRHVDSAVVASVWRPLGALNTFKEPFEVEERPVDVYPMRVAGNMRLLNIWLAQGTNPCKGSVLYLYWDREYAPLDDTVDLSAIGRKDDLMFMLSEGQDADGDVDMQVLSETSVLPGRVPRNITSAAFQQHSADPDGLNFRWQLKVYVSVDGGPPPPSLFNDGSTIGTYYLIGSVMFESMIPSTIEMGCEMQRRAFSALHPRDPSVDYRANFKKGFPMITVFGGTC
jgi:hypothetical protein